MHHRITQVNFEFGRGLMINCRVIPLEEIFSFRSLSMYKVEIACVYRYVIGRFIDFDRVIPLEL
jgi:hypothetical protein